MGIRPVRVALLAVGLTLAAPLAAGASGKAPMGVRKIAPAVSCSVVAWPQGGAAVAPGQTVKIRGYAGKVWMKLVLENRGPTSQTLTATLILWDGPRQAVNRPLPNLTLAPDGRLETASWSMDLGEGTHKVRAGGTLDLKGNALGNGCGPLDFTVAVAPPTLFPEKAKVRSAVTAPDLVCRVKVAQGAPTNAFAPGQPVTSVDGRFWVQVEIESRGTVKPDTVPVHIVVDEGTRRLFDRTETVRLTTYNGTANHAFTLAPGQHGLVARGGLLIPANKGSNDCAVSFSATVQAAASPPPGAPPGVPARPLYFTQTIYPLLTRPGCVYCHQTQEDSASHVGVHLLQDRNCTRCHGRDYVDIQARPFLAFQTTAPKPAAELCGALRGRVISGHHAQNPSSLFNEALRPMTDSQYQSVLTNWRDFGSPPGYVCP